MIGFSLNKKDKKIQATQCVHFGLYIELKIYVNHGRCKRCAGQLRTPRAFSHHWHSRPRLTSAENLLFGRLAASLAANIR